MANHKAHQAGQRHIQAGTPLDSSRRHKWVRVRFVESLQSDYGDSRLDVFAVEWLWVIQD
jgi:hypothetical protein